MGAIRCEKERDCFELLGVQESATLDERGVHAAFRRKARLSHPDSSGFTRESVDFRELVRARDEVLLAVKMRDSNAVSGAGGSFPFAAPTEGAFGAEAREAMTKGMREAMTKGMRYAVRRHILYSSESHGYYMQFASWCRGERASRDGACADDAEGGGWPAFIARCVREYHTRNTRVVRVESTLDAVFDGDVYIWTDKTNDASATKWLVPLWHSALYFEEVGAVFAVDILPITPGDVDQYVRTTVRAARENVKGIRHEVSGDTNDVELWVDVRVLGSVGFSLDSSLSLDCVDTVEGRVPEGRDRNLLYALEVHIGRSVLRLNPNEVRVTTGREGRDTYTWVFPNAGPYVPNDDDIFDMERRSTVTLHATE